MRYQVFEIFLLRNTEEPLKAADILDALVADGKLRTLRSDPSRFYYRNDDTSVFFPLVLAPEIVSLWRSRFHHGGSEELEGTEAASEAEREEEPEENSEDEEEDEDASFHIETPPLMLGLPLLCPSFFGKEALAFAQRLLEAGDLHLVHTQPEEAQGEAPLHAEEALSPTDILSILKEETRKHVLSLEDRSGLTVWSARKAEEWWSYGKGRANLEAALEADHVRVPALQAADHRGGIKSLCAWELGTPTVLPRSDLVLIRRKREHKGLFRSRRFLEEGLVGGEKLWDVLAPFSELRKEPAEILIFREAMKPPAQVGAELEALPLEPLENTRKTEIIGVIDFEPPTD